MQSKQSSLIIAKYLKKMLSSKIIKNIIKLNVILAINLQSINLYSKDTIRVIYPNTGPEKSRDYYPLKVLKLALEKMNYNYEIIQNKDYMTQSRVVESLKHNIINLIWVGPNIELENSLRIIEFPISFGILSYRVSIINKSNQGNFSKVKTIDDLKKFKILQGIGWSDVKILKESNFMVEESNYLNIFKKININREQFLFPRGINEVFQEIEDNIKEYPNLSVEKNFAIFYPFDLFYFTNKKNIKLAKIIEKGLNIAYNDGSHLKLFQNDPIIKYALKNANLKKRKIFYIENKHISTKTSNSILNFSYKP